MKQHTEFQWEKAEKKAEGNHWYLSEHGFTERNISMPQHLSYNMQMEEVRTLRYISVFILLRYC